MYLLAHALLRDQFASLAAALLLAVNPLHSYMSKYPVSEVPTAFFFLSALYFFVRLLRHDHARLFDLSMMALSFTCLFFTRITGFLHTFALVGLLLCVTIFCTSRLRRRAMFLACAATGAGYVYSVVHGCLLSPSYSQQIYYRRFGFDGFSLDTVITLLIVLVAIAGSYALIVRNRSSLRRIAARVHPYRRGISFAAVLFALAAVACRGFTFAFTDLAQHAWLGAVSTGLKLVDAKLKLSGTGLPALLISDISVLSVILTPLGFALSLYGLYLMLRRWPSDPSFFICGSLGVFFLVVYGVGHGFRPILYLWGRYLLSELVPLLILAIGIALSQLRRRYPRAAVAVLILMCLPPLGLSYLHTRDTEMKYLYNDLARINEVLGSKALVLVDERIMPNRERMNLPLTLLFDQKTFWFSRDDLERGKLDGVLRLFADKGYRIFVIANDDQLNSDQFKPHRKMPVRLTRMSKTLGSWPVSFGLEQSRTWTIYSPTEDLRTLQKAPKNVLDSREELL